MVLLVREFEMSKYWVAGACLSLLLEGAMLDSFLQQYPLEVSDIKVEK
jgi:hypothetical protein